MTLGGVMGFRRTIKDVITQVITTASEAKRHAVIIYGARQTGKTTLSKELVAEWGAGAVYYNCDTLDVQAQFSHANAHHLAPVLQGVRLLVLDEAQRIVNIGLVIKIIVDQYPAVQVVATGSSSFELSNQINEPLTGRKRVFQLYPLSFEEMYTSTPELERRARLEFHLRFGSYPEVATMSEVHAVEHLRELCGSYLFRDILEFRHLRHSAMLTQLLQLLALQIGSEVSFHELAQQLRVDQTVIQDYIHLLEQGFILFRVPALQRNLRNELKKSRKIYFWDLGIRNALIQNHLSLQFRLDVGALWENYAIAERLKRYSNYQTIVTPYFWRTYSQQEIDYIEDVDGILNAFEFKWAANKKWKAPRSFQNAYPETPTTLITPTNGSAFLLPG